MKILHVINSLSTGGAERLLADLIPLQQKYGHLVDAVIFRGGDTPCRKLLDRATTGKVYDFGVGMSVYSPLNVLRLIPFMRKYDVIHVHLFPAQYWVALAKLLSFSKARLVTTEHNTTNRRRSIPGFRWLDKLIYLMYEKVISCSVPTYENLIAYLKTYPRNNRYVTIPNGISLDVFEGAKPLDKNSIGVGAENFLVIQVASFRPQKDPETLIRSVRLLPDSFHIFFVGNGEKRVACERLSCALGVQHRIHFLGIRSDVPALLKTADVVVLSSHFEGLSLASIEGMASGRSFLASDVPGLAEVVGGAGILFPKGDEKALAEIILKLASDKEFYEKTAAACSRRAQDYDIRKTAEAYLAVYENRVI